MAGDAFHTPGLRSAFSAEVKRSTQATAVAAGLIAIIAMPAWAGFDHLVDPEHASTFTLIRLSLEIPLIALWLSLFTSFGRRRPELIMLIFLTLIEASIAYMIARVEDAYAPYSLGISLAIYGSAFLLIWPWQYTAALIGLTWLAVATAVAAAPEPLPTSAIATIAFYLGTASLVGFLGQYFRQAGAWSEFRNRIELEREHERNEELRRRLERLSREDPLTGLANRRSWDETLAREFERTRRQDGTLTVILCDLDRLKDINDRYGHAVGDQVLKVTADAAPRARPRERPGRADRRGRVRRALPGHLAGERERRGGGAAHAAGRAERLGGARARADALDRRGGPRARRHLADGPDAAGRRPPLPRQGHAQRGLGRRARGPPGRSRGSARGRGPPSRSARPGARAAPRPATLALSGSVSGHSTPNSSPPSRAARSLARTRSRSTSAVALSTRSPWRDR